MTVLCEYEPLSLAILTPNTDHCVSGASFGYSVVMDASKQPPSPVPFFTAIFLTLKVSFSRLEDPENFETWFLPFFHWFYAFKKLNSVLQFHLFWCRDASNAKSKAGTEKNEAPSNHPFNFCDAM